LRRQATAILWLFCLAAAAHAQPRVKGAANYPPNSPIVLKATDVTSAKAQFLWDVSGGAKFVEAGDDPLRLGPARGLRRPPHRD
jgi:hypothetical protein